MRKLIFNSVYLLSFLLVSITTFSQNLIQNPGFESDITSWNNIWSQDGAGTATIVTSPVKSGAKAIKINYTGIQNWLFQTSNKINVTPGQQYELSCWTQSINVSNEAYLSAILYDSKNNVLDWSYSPSRFDKTSIGYKKYTTRFVVPENVSSIQPGLIGLGAADFYTDEVSFVLIDSPGVSGDFVIETDNMKAVVSLPLISINLTNKASSKTYQTKGNQFVMVKSVNRINSQSIIVASQMFDELKSPVNIEFTVDGKALRIKISGDSTLVLNSDIIFPGIIASKASDYLIIPRGTGIIRPVTIENPYSNFDPNGWKSTMPFVGVTNLQDGYMVVSDDQWDTEFTFEKPTDQTYYSFQLRQKPAKNILGYNRTIYMVLVDNGYVEMCNWYREHAGKIGYIKTFRQKNIENPNIDKLIGAVDFWALNWTLKPGFLDSVKLMGMDKAIWNLTGSWGKHNFSQIIDSINAKGFLSGRYDIFTDVWPPGHPEWYWFRSEGFPGDIIVGSDGQLRKGWVAYPDNLPFQGYYSCSETHLAYAKKHVPEDLSSNHYNSRFIDVELASPLTECSSKDHPTTRKEDAAARNRLLSYIKNDLKLVAGVEEAHDFAFRNVDYSEGTMSIEVAANASYDWSVPVDPADKTYVSNNLSPMQRIPLHGLVYHDVHLPTWYTGDGASKVPSGWDDKNLWNMLYGTMPLYLPPSLAYWKANFEKYISGYQYISAITRNVGYEKMVNHQFISNDWKIQETSFENNWNVVVNFDSIPRFWNNKNLAAKGFYASDGKKYEVYKTIVNDHPLGWVFTGDRLFLNPYGIETALNGVRTSQAVFVQKFPDYLLVSFVGTQSYVDLNITELPFGIGAINRVADYYSGSSVSLINLTSGWKRLNRPAGKCYFKIYYTAKTAVFSSLHSQPGIKVFPNPARDQLTIERTEISGDACLTICNQNGQQLIRQSFPGNKIIVDTRSLASGLYFLNFIQDKLYEVRKFIKQ